MDAGRAHIIKKFIITLFCDVLTLGAAALLAQLIATGSWRFSADGMLFLGAELLFALVVFAVCGLYRMRLPIAGMSEAFRVIASFAALLLFDLVYLSLKSAVLNTTCALLLLI